MQNDEGKIVDKYIPRKWYVHNRADVLAQIGVRVAMPAWGKASIFAYDDDGIVGSSWTQRLITSDDHASVQLCIGHVDQNGVYTGETTTFAISGVVRARVCRFWPE